MSNLVNHARRELELAGLFDKDSDYNGMMGKAVLDLVEKFAAEGHSGFSAGMCISLFSRVASFKTLTPLTGADDEWTEVSDMEDLRWQNKRCSSVFKRADGTAYDIDAVVFEEPDGTRFQGYESRRVVTFPYIPKTEIVKINAPRQS